jgi:hypothetical protein
MWAGGYQGFEMLLQQLRLPLQGGLQSAMMPKLVGLANARRNSANQCVIEVNALCAHGNEAPTVNGAPQSRVRLYEAKHLLPLCNAS